MTARIIGAAFALLLCYGFWQAFEQITVLRRSVFWEYRYVILVAGGFVFLSILDWAITKISVILSSKTKTSDISSE